MHAFGTTFLALCLAHLLTDLVFESDRRLARRKRGEVVAYLEHGGLHLVTTAMLAGFAGPASARSVSFYAVLTGLTLAHLALDWGRFAVAKGSEQIRVLVTGQTLRVLTMAVAAELLTGTSRGEWVAAGSWVQSHAEKTLLILVAYVGVVFGGGRLVRVATKPLLSGDLGLVGHTAGELQNAGMYIGWLERFLIMTSLMLQSPATAGLILAAKSIARYPEFKSERFAEYFLIGTLLSISLGIMGGLVLWKVL